MFGDETGYPFAELLISGGFFFVMIVEQIVMECFEKKKPKTTICTCKKTILWLLHPLLIQPAMYLIQTAGEGNL